MTSIALARKSIEHLIALYEANENGTNHSVCANAKHGAVILAWLERRQELMKALDRLERERPDLVDLLNAFPGAQIADVRDSYHNGSGIDD